MLDVIFLKMSKLRRKMLIEFLEKWLLFWQMGYANPAQVTAGIHTRQFSRAFVIDDGSTRVVFVNVDCGMIDQIIKTEVCNL